MDDPRNWITGLLLLFGGFFALTGALGILRMPDFYTRLHPAGKADTLAQSCFMIGLLFQVQGFTDGAKLVMVWLFLLMSTPTATHAITQAAHVAGLRPWQPEEQSDADL